MNTTDELLTVPPPPKCRQCMHIEERVTLGVERCRCLKGRPMHEMCGWFDAKAASVAGSEARHG